MEPTTNGGNGGRDTQGRFAKGNAGGPGNPHAQRVARLRSALLGAVTPEDLNKIVDKLVKMAKGGNVVAAKEVLDRCLGKPRAEVELTHRAEVVKLYAPGPMEEVLGERKLLERMAEDSDEVNDEGQS